MQFRKGVLEGLKDLGQAAKNLSNVRLLAQYHPLGQHLVPNQRKKLSGQDLAIFVTKKIIKNVKNREISSFFNKLFKCCKEPDFLSWPSGQKHPKKFVSGPEDVLADAQMHLLREKRLRPSIGQDLSSIYSFINLEIYEKFQFLM